MIIIFNSEREFKRKCLEFAPDGQNRLSGNIWNVRSLKQHLLVRQKGHCFFRYQQKMMEVRRHDGVRWGGSFFMSKETSQIRVVLFLSNFAPQAKRNKGSAFSVNRFSARLLHMWEPWLKIRGLSIYCLLFILVPLGSLELSLVIARPRIAFG